MSLEILANSKRMKPVGTDRLQDYSHNGKYLILSMTILNEFYLC